jgi:general secretion pathway protein A
MTSPFSISPDPAGLYLTTAIRSVLQQIERAIEFRQGLSLLAGDVGLGKSTVLRYLYGRFDAREDITALLIPSPKWPTEFAMARFLAGSFGLAPARSLADQVEGLRQAIITEFAGGKNCVVFIDESQILLPSQVELIRSMLNFETDTEKMIQFVLAAQLDLSERLRHRSYKAFRSRIYADITLEPMTFEDMVGMLRRRCEVADVDFPFDDTALRSIYETAAGVPRSILRICDRMWAREISNEKLAVRS